MELKTLVELFNQYKDTLFGRVVSKWSQHILFDRRLRDAIVKCYPFSRADFADADGNTLLHAAARKGSLVLILRILSHDTRALVKRNNRGMLPLEVALMYDRYNVALFFVFLSYIMDRVDKTKNGNMLFAELQTAHLH